MTDTVNKPEGAAKESRIKKARIRSPNYPAIGLPKAMDRVKELYDAYKHSPIPMGAAHVKWGYKPLGSAGYQIVSALKAYGLVDFEGEGDKRLVRLSERARKIVGGHPDRDNFVREAALNPPVYADLWEKYKAEGLPPDETLQHHLQWERNFNPDSIKGFIADLRDTIAYAKLTATGTMGDGGNSSDAPIDIGGDKPPKKSTAQMQPPKGLELPEGGTNMRTDTFILEEGPAVALQYPGTWSQSSYEDFKDWMEIELRKIKRLIKADSGGTQVKETQ